MQSNKIEEIKKRIINEDGRACIPDEVYDAIDRYAKYKFGKSIGEVIQGYSEDINQRFNILKSKYKNLEEGGPSGETEIYRDEWDTLAYLLHYFYTNYPKIKYILLENLEKGREIIPQNKTVNILDIGTGPGTVLLGTAHFLQVAQEGGYYKDTKIKAYYHEKNPYFKEMCKIMLSNVDVIESMRECEHKHGFYDIITISNVLQELDPVLRVKYLSNLKKGLKGDGYLIIIEPIYEGMIDDFQKLRNDINSEWTEVSCNFWGDGVNYCKTGWTCCLRRDRIETPMKTTQYIKKYLEKYGNVISYVYAVLQKAEYVSYKKSEKEPINNEKYTDPLNITIEKPVHRGKYARREDIYGKVVRVYEVAPTHKGDVCSIILCNGFGGCILEFWRENIKKSEGIKEGNILFVEDAPMSGKRFNGAMQVYINEYTKIHIQESRHEIRPNSEKLETLINQYKTTSGESRAKVVYEFGELQNETAIETL